jgi:hypothetical protein
MFQAVLFPEVAIATAGNLLTLLNYSSEAQAPRPGKGHLLYAVGQSLYAVGQTAGRFKPVVTAHAWVQLIDERFGFTEDTKRTCAILAAFSFTSLMMNIVFATRRPDSNVVMICLALALMMTSALSLKAKLLRTDVVVLVTATQTLTALLLEHGQINDFQMDVLPELAMAIVSTLGRPDMSLFEQMWATIARNIPLLDALLSTMNRLLRGWTRKPVQLLQVSAPALLLIGFRLLSAVRRDVESVRRAEIIVAFDRHAQRNIHGASPQRGKSQRRSDTEPHAFSGKGQRLDDVDRRAPQQSPFSGEAITLADTNVDDTQQSDPQAGAGQKRSNTDDATHTSSVFMSASAPLAAGRTERAPKAANARDKRFDTKPGVGA